MRLTGTDDRVVPRHRRADVDVWEVGIALTVRVPLIRHKLDAITRHEGIDVTNDLDPGAAGSIDVRDVEVLRNVKEEWD